MGQPSDAVTAPRAWSHEGRARTLIALAFVAVAVVVSGVLAQLTRPFIRRDDWPFLLPPGTPGAADPLGKVRGEGRWLSYGWWLAVGQHGTPVTAVVLFFVAYLLFVVGLWRLFRVTNALAAGLLGVALLVSPLWVRLVYWPGTLTASALVAAAGVWTLPWAARRRPTLVGWMLVVAVLAVLTYPPVGGLLLIAAVVHLRDRPWREVVLVAAVFLAGFAAGTVLTFLAAQVAFGHLGPEIAAWRRPNALTSVSDLRVNAGRYLRQAFILARTLGWAGVVGALAVVVGLFDARVRPALLRLALAVALVAGLEMLQTLVTGVRTNVRGSLWAWVAVVAVTGLLLFGSRWSRRAGVAALAVLSVVGLLAWRSDLGIHQETRRQYDAIVASATADTQPGAAPRVVFYQPPHERRTTRGGITAGTLRMMFFEQEGVVVRWCRPDECARLADLAPSGPVHDLGGVTGVVVPSPPAVL